MVDTRTGHAGVGSTRRRSPGAPAPRGRRPRRRAATPTRPRSSRKRPSRPRSSAPSRRGRRDPPVDAGVPAPARGGRRTASATDDHGDRFATGPPGRSRTPWTPTIGWRSSRETRASRDRGVDKIGQANGRMATAWAGATRRRPRRIPWTAATAARALIRTPTSSPTFSNEVVGMIVSTHPNPHLPRLPGRRLGTERTTASFDLDGLLATPDGESFVVGADKS